MIATPRSCIYRGQLRHRRFVPCGHAFSYQLWMAWLDLDELPRLFTQVPGFSAQRSALARYRREDYLAPHDRPLKQAVRERLASELGGDLAAAADGRLCMLAQLRLCGVTFNPLTLYYAYDRHERLRAVLGEEPHAAPAPSVRVSSEERRAPSPARRSSRARPWTRC